jgi:hypothetical protein
MHDRRPCGAELIAALDGPMGPHRRRSIDRRWEHEPTAGPVGRQAAGRFAFASTWSEGPISDPGSMVIGVAVAPFAAFDHHDAWWEPSPAKRTR